VGVIGRYAGFVDRRARLVLAITVLSAIFSITRIVDFETLTPRLVFDSSMESLLPEKDEERVFYSRVRRIFGSDETLLLALHQEDGVFDVETLSAVERLTERIEELDGVHHVVSLANAPLMRSADGDLEIAPLWEQLPEDAAGLAALREEALASPLLAGTFVSEDARSTALLVYLMDIGEAEFTALGLDYQLRDLAAEELPGAEAWLAGGAHVRAETTRFVLSDLAFMIPGVVLLMATIAFFSFRSVRGVLVPLTTVGVAVFWTMAIAVELTPSLNLVTVAVPNIILVIGFAYAVHVLNSYTFALQEPEVRSGALTPARRGLESVALPTLLTGATTGAGFIALMTSPLEAIQQFGLLSAIGVLCTMVAALTYAPALLALLPVPPEESEAAVGAGDRVDRLLRALGRFNVRRRGAIMLAALAIAAVSVVGMLRIELNTSMIENFSPDARVRRDFEAINANLGGAGQVQVVLELAEREGWKEPTNLAVLEEIQGWLLEQPEVGHVMSLLDYVKLINRGFHEDRADYYAIPASKVLVSQLLFFGGSDEVERFVDSQYRVAILAVRSRVVDSAKVALLVKRIEDRLERLPEYISGRVTGGSVLVARTNDDIAYGQATSLISAFFIIYVILAMLFTSLRVGMVALVPNALPVLVYFGVLGWAGISLNAVTGLVACLVLGIAVDDTIHFFAHFNIAAKRLASEERGAEEALVHVGRPITYTTVALCLGFLVLVFSSLQNQVEFGALAAFTLAVAWLIDLSLTPAIASRLRIVTLWDALTLDLGEHPEEAIRLFHGLSKTQARLAALMTEIVEVPAGRRLMTAGEKSDGMYVIIDGVLRASIERGGEVVPLNEHRRGDVIGEVGLFEGERTADVDCETDARLLRLDEDNLARLRRRYPRIGVQLYRNLSQILARRLNAATSRVS
jgi:predicted RND superfamily exporter protein/CRP-like cAMP-binding protein